MRNQIVIHAGKRELERFLPVIQAYALGTFVERARELLERVSGRTAALVFEWDTTAPAASVALLRRLRERYPLLPMAVLVPAQASGALGALTRFDAECLPCGAELPVLHRFVQRSIVFGALPDDAVARCVAVVAQARGLTPREVQIVSLALGHATRERIRRVLGVTENTLKKQVRGLLRKVDERSLDSLAKNVLRTALLEARPGSAGLYRAPWWEGDRTAA